MAKAATYLHLDYKVHADPAKKLTDKTEGSLKTAAALRFLVVLSRATLSPNLAPQHSLVSLAESHPPVTLLRVRAKIQHIYHRARRYY